MPPLLTEYVVDTIAVFTHTLCVAVFVADVIAIAAFGVAVIVPVILAEEQPPEVVTVYTDVPLTVGLPLTVNTPAL